ncbi:MULTISPECIES: ABC transporter permease [Nonlabens]|uniref:Lipoprotein-releasing system permease protein n=1 Tax=Nonlabens xylanidelens TaxID=191564 RepID=A0A2S6IRD0_9FLAO|nr:FtsX-like permease family protein [Nonlabens xylanidelens]PPK96731.1 lipoprotein-releasing system permease protein [Nonlabens xylanidelens]PQJ13443.1 ABC transporter permease [Nonlabens xylanidelens]
MNFSLYIARRYLVSKNGKNAINIINILSFIITVVGTAALFIVLSGFSGLKDFSTEFSNYFDPDLKILPVKGKTVSIPLSRKRELEKIPGVELICAVIEEKAFLNYEEKNDIAFIKGVPDDYVNMIQPDSILYYGSWLSKSDAQVVAGYSLASRLSLTVNNYGSYMQIMVPKPGTNAINKLNISSSFSRMDAIPVGTFSVNEALDSKYIFTRISAARQLLQMDDSTASAVEVKLSPTASENDVRRAINDVFKEPIKIKDKFQMNDALYKMLNSENLVVYLIFTLVLIIALFNVVGSIIMMILDKKKNMKTLLDLGAPVASLRKIFFIQGSLMTLSGGVIGLVIGVIFVVLQVEYKLVYIAPGLPYPFAMDFWNVIISLATITVLGIIASYIGSRRINDRLLSQAKL